jgi:hypothetical protein
MLRNFFSSALILPQIKLECLSLTNFSRLVLHFQLKQKLAELEHLRVPTLLVFPWPYL